VPRLLRWQVVAFFMESQHYFQHLPFRRLARLSTWFFSVSPSSYPTGGWMGDRFPARRVVAAHRPCSRPLLRMIVAVNRKQERKNIRSIEAFRPE
jgi:hypothetical protein